MSSQLFGNPAAASASLITAEPPTPFSLVDQLNVIRQHERAHPDEPVPALLRALSLAKYRRKRYASEGVLFDTAVGDPSPSPSHLCDCGHKHWVFDEEVDLFFGIPLSTDTKLASIWTYTAPEDPRLVAKEVAHRIGCSTDSAAIQRLCLAHLATYQLFPSKEPAPSPSPLPSPSSGAITTSLSSSSSAAVRDESLASVRLADDPLMSMLISKPKAKANAKTAASSSSSSSSSSSASLSSSSSKPTVITPAPSTPSIEPVGRSSLTNSCGSVQFAPIDIDLSGEDDNDDNATNGIPNSLASATSPRGEVEADGQSGMSAEEQLAESRRLRQERFRLEQQAQQEQRQLEQQQLLEQQQQRERERQQQYLQQLQQQPRQLSRKQYQMPSGGSKPQDIPPRQPAPPSHSTNAAAAYLSQPRSRRFQSLEEEEQELDRELDALENVVRSLEGRRSSFSLEVQRNLAEVEMRLLEGRLAQQRRQMARQGNLPNTMTNSALPTFQSFSGAGRRLGEADSIHQPPSFDSLCETITVTVKLADGGTLVGRFNPTHTVRDIHELIVSLHPHWNGTGFHLECQNMKLLDSLTIDAAELAGQTIVQMLPCF